MKNKIVKMMLALGCAVTFAAVSGQALAHCCKHHSYRSYAYYGCQYHRICGHMMSHHIQGRPVIYMNGEYVYALKCSHGYWKHHVWHCARCS